jgi:hypothetical protein
MQHYYQMWHAMNVAMVATQLRGDAMGCGDAMDVEMQWM